MSENPNSSESAVEETVPVPPTDAAQPEPTSAPKKGDKKKMWVVVVAIIVVAALIGSAAYMFVFAGEKLDVTMTPDDDPLVVPAGFAIDLSVEVEYGDPVTRDDGVVYLWSVVPSTLGDFDRVAQAEVEFTAGTETGEGTISCEVTYESKSKVVERDITIDPPFLETVDVLPSQKELALDAEWDFNATAYDSVGAEVTGATFSWTVSGAAVGDYTLNATVGSSVTFSASMEAIVTLTATATDGDETASGSATVNVTAADAVRSIDYYWDDFFNHPLGEWYDLRLFNYGDEYAITDAYPYLYVWEGSPPGNIWIYTMSRLNMDGKNMPELNMNDNPEFLPYFGTARGGTATLDWYMDYITNAEAEARLGAGSIIYHDGWLVKWGGETTLDRQAAKAVLGITDDGFDDFDTWWASNGADVRGEWESWLGDEASNDRLAIYAAYKYDLTLVNFDLDAQKVGDNIVVTIDTISWGMEALMFRWMYEAWMPTEWYLEDMNFDAVIGPERADVTLDTAVGYMMYAYGTTEDDPADPCWAWEALKQDYLPASSEYPISDFEVYKDFTYYNLAPGSEWYDMDMAWDYTPATWDLGEGETLTFEWPEDEVMFFTHSPGSDGEIADIGVRPVPDTTNFMDTMTCLYAEPMESDAPDCVEIDLDSRTISYTGPFDMLNWSSTQTAHEWLEDEWERMEILPYGAPFIEFRPGSTVSLDLRVEDVLSPLEIGEASSFNVTIVNEMTDEPYTPYTGTVTFESNDPAAVLPDDYTFVPADMGTHEFTVVFNTVDPVTHTSSYYVTASDVADATLAGTQSGILVQESQRIGSFDVAYSGAEVIAGETEDVTVTAYNQWDELFTDYDGTVNFASDDVGADLPADTAFTPVMEGVQVFSVTFSAAGTYELNVSDVSAPEAYGVASVDVLSAPVIDYFVLSGVDSPTNYMDDPDQTMTVTAYDDYGDEFFGYEGTVTFESNESAGIVLPPDTAFTLGVSSITVDLTFSAVESYTIWCNDSVDSSVTGSLEVQVVDYDVGLASFEVTGVEDMWENNYSDITVRAINDLGGTFENYVGTITFDTNAPSGETLPDDYTFVLADNGVRTFPLAVSFDVPGTFNVTVSDTSDSTLNGSQEDIVIDNLEADSMAITGPDTAIENATFSVTVTVYHQYGDPFEEYGGTVAFSTSDTSGYELLPSDYEFQPADLGTHEFTDGVSLSEVGPQTVDVTDTVLSATLDVDITAFVDSSITYKIYDMFGEAWEPYWDARVESATWDTERILTEDAGDVTYLYSLDPNPKGHDDQGLIYAPYRWNIDATSIPNMDVHTPMLMPEPSSPVAGAEATVDVYSQYVYTGTGTWWEDYWIATWDGRSDWVGDTFADGTDGYYSGTVYTVTMNREAAEEWLGMPQGDTAATWWADNGDTYESDWEAWIYDQGNNVFDIFNGYEWPYYDLGTFMSLTGDSTEVVLDIAHLSWGWEALLTRWLNDTQVSVHQPYFEDITLQVDYKDSMCDFYMDAVCQWSMHAVKQNASAEGDNAPCAWVWEPLGFDYVPSKTAHPESQYDDYAYSTYESWNCGDTLYSTEVNYEGTPWAFSLPAYGTLIIELPMGDTLPGYYAEVVPEGAIESAWGGDFTDYDDIRYRGSMEPGFNITGGAPGITYNPTTKVMTIPGPFDFTNPRGDGTLYHGAPWLEFNIVEAPPKAASSAVSPVECAPSLGGVVAEESAAAAAVSTAGEIVSLVGVMCAVLLAIAALAVGSVRRQDLL